MDTSSKSGGGVAMGTGGVVILAALLSAAVTATIDPIMVVLVGVGLVLFGFGAALHDRGSQRPPPSNGFHHITDIAHMDM
jgi:hypothetical protein